MDLLRALSRRRSLWLVLVVSTLAVAAALADWTGASATDAPCACSETERAR